MYSWLEVVVTDFSIPGPWGILYPWLRTDSRKFFNVCLHLVSLCVYVGRMGLTLKYLITLTCFIRCFTFAGIAMVTFKLVLHTHHYS